jgi:predicted AlkP superfamily phosphohydrolase/phosphomutase
VKEVYRREELFTGPYLGRIPDLLIHFDTSVLVRTELASAVWGESPVSDLKELSGDHDLNGMFVAAGPDIRGGGLLANSSLLDVAPTMLCALGQSIPENMDGRVLEDIFAPSFLLAYPPRRDRSRKMVERTGENVFSIEEDAAVRERLQALGYLGE